MIKSDTVSEDLVGIITNTAKSIDFGGDDQKRREIDRCREKNHQKCREIDQFSERKMVKNAAQSTSPSGAILLC